MRKLLVLVLALALLGALAIGCTLNPQPLPPLDTSAGAPDGGTYASQDARATQDTGVSDDDGGAADAGDAGVDASDADASDAEIDAGALDAGGPG